MSNDVLVFYSKSADAKPGEGAHEFVHDVSKYDALADQRHWRRALSNFDASIDFAWTGSDLDVYTWNEGTQWRSIEHAFQATKIALQDPSAAFRFTVNSQSVLGLSDGSAAQKQRKMVLLTDENIARWNAVSDHVMESIARAKYAAGPSIARRVLKSTRDARLVHLMKQRGKPSQLVRFKFLEDIRATLD